MSSFVRDHDSSESVIGIEPLYKASRILTEAVDIHASALIAAEAVIEMFDSVICFGHRSLIRYSE